MRFSIVSAVIASAGLVAAAPASEPGKRETNFGGLGPLSGLLGNSGSGTANGVGNAGQNALALLFGSADAVLNNPLDLVTNLISNPLGTPAQTAKNLMGSAAGIAKGAGSVVGAIPSGVAQDMSKANKADNKTN